VKVVIVILVLALGYLFYPFRDLYIREDPFDDNLTLAATGFWTVSGCIEAAGQLRAQEYRCPKRTLWSKLLNTYSQYDPAIREQKKGESGGLGRELMPG
jgi:hypothetical protein